MLTSKDKRTLKAMASRLPSVVQIGNDGLSNPVIDSARAVLTARELIKIHVLKNADSDIRETAAALAGMLGAELVQTIGHYGILFKKKKEKSKFDFIKG